MYIYTYIYIYIYILTFRRIKPIDHKLVELIKVLPLSDVHIPNNVQGSFD